MAEGSPATVAEALKSAQDAGVDRLDAHMLLARVMDRPRTWLLAHDDAALDAGQRHAWHAHLARRAAGEPLAYLLGEKEFFGLPLQVSRHVLVPRPDTEALVDWAIDVLDQRDPLGPSPQALDLGTGSGAIALALKRAHPAAAISAVDISTEALAVAMANGRTLGLRVGWRQGDWWSALAADERFDLIVSNPPYIAEEDTHLAALRHEPMLALTSGPDGLSALRHIVSHAPAHLKPGAWLLLEHGHDQAGAVQSLLDSAGFQSIASRRDLAGQPRCTGGQWPLPNGSPPNTSRTKPGHKA